MATLYKTDGRVMQIDPVNGKRFTYDEVRDYIGCQWLEHLTSCTGNGKSAYYDEEGRFKHLPENPKALHALFTKLGYATIDRIVGNMIILNPSEDLP